MLNKILYVDALFFYNPKELESGYQGIVNKKVQEGNEQEKAQSERNSYTKIEVGKVGAYT